MDEVQSQEVDMSAPVLSVTDNIIFSAQSVKEIEDKAKKPIMQVVSEFEISNLAILVMKGLRTNENGAYEAIDAYIAENPENDTMTLQTLIIKKLTSQGFLPKKLNLAEKVNQGIERMTEMDMSTLEING